MADVPARRDRNRPPTDRPTKVLAIDRLPATRVANLGVKAALAAAFFVALVFQPEVVDGKAMGFRAPLFLAPAVVVPILARTRGWEPYPHTADALASAPFLIDTLGNLFGFYDRFNATDDVLHAINWILLVGAFHAFRFRNVHRNDDAVLLGYGFGAITIIWWEVMEWVVSTDGIGGAGGLNLTYGDTVGDLLLSSTGGLVGSIVGVLLLGAAGSRSPTGEQPTVR